LVDGRIETDKVSITQWLADLSRFVELLSSRVDAKIPYDLAAISTKPVPYTFIVNHF